MTAGATAARPPFAEATRSLLRETVLDAVGELVSARPWDEVSMAAVAERAGVSRQTLYNEFGSRLELAKTYVMREADRFLDAVEAAVLASGPDPREALTAALDVFLSNAESHPVIRAITLGEGGDELVTLVTTRGGGLVADVTERLAGLLKRKWSGVRMTDARLISETLARLAISHAALPSASPDRTAKSIAAVLGPYADELVAAAN